MKKSEGDVVDPQKQLGSQYLNYALREDVQFIGIPKANYAMQRRIGQCDDSKAQ